MKLLITGACGFVGSTLTKALLEHSDSLEITGIDNFSRSGSWLNRDKLIAMGVNLIHGDIRNAADLEVLGSFDWVIDAAANPSVLAGVDGKSSSRQLVEHNLGGTINLLEACKRWNAGFILLSTSRVYSIPPLANLKVEVKDHAFRPVLDGSLPGISEHGISEEFSTAPPVSLYGSTKLTSETLALEYGEAFDFPVWINRCGVMAGAGQFGKPDQGIFAFWIHCWREGRPLRYIGFEGMGHQVRDCLHPKDLAPLLLKQTDPQSSSSTSRTINVSGGIESAMSLRQLSDWCKGRFPGSETPEHPQSHLPKENPNISSPVRPFDLPWVVLDSSDASTKWGWNPQINTLTILNEIADFSEKAPGWIKASA